MANIKYRQFVNGKFHYWGFLRDEFTEHLCFFGPVTSNQPNAKHDQFTGLTDKNGVDIYEGDILISDFFSGNLEVIYSKNIASFIFKGNSLNGEFAGFHQYESKNFEVIGNTHQHPELLK